MLAASLGAHRKAQHADVDAEMDLNDLMAVFLVISRSTSVLGSAGRSFLPAELRAAFCWSSAKQRKSVKKTMLITRGESEPDTGSVLELDDDAQGFC